MANEDTISTRRKLAEHRVKIAEARLERSLAWGESVEAKQAELRAELESRRIVLEKLTIS